MTPIFKEYIDFLNEKTNNACDFLEEGIYWHDNSMIKAFDTEGNIVDVAFIEDNNSNISVRLCKNVSTLEKWIDTCKRREDDLLDLEEESLIAITSALEKYRGRHIATLSNDDKDTKLINYLVKDCCVGTVSIPNHTSINKLDRKNKYLFFMSTKNKNRESDEWRSKHWGKRKWDAVFPIRKWTELDKWLYILLYNVPIGLK